MCRVLAVSNLAQAALRTVKGASKVAVVAASVEGKKTFSIGHLDVCGARCLRQGRCHHGRAGMQVAA